VDQHLTHGRRVHQPERRQGTPHGAAADALLLSIMCRIISPGGPPTCASTRTTCHPRSPRQWRLGVTRSYGTWRTRHIHADYGRLKRGRAGGGSGVQISQICRLTVDAFMVTPSHVRCGSPGSYFAAGACRASWVGRTRREKGRPARCPHHRPPGRNGIGRANGEWTKRGGQSDARPGPTPAVLGGSA
jgi:hypothetical protein